MSVVGVKQLHAQSANILVFVLLTSQAITAQCTKFWQAANANQEFFLLCFYNNALVFYIFLPYKTGVIGTLLGVFDAGCETRKGRKKNKKITPVETLLIALFLPQGHPQKTTNQKTC